MYIFLIDDEDKENIVLSIPCQETPKLQQMVSITYSAHKSQTHSNKSGTADPFPGAYKHQ